MQDALQVYTQGNQRLNIFYDDNAMSPREWDNLGFFLTRDNGYKSPDGKDNPLYQIMIDAEGEAEDAESHMKLMKKMAKKQGIKVLAIYPIYKYEHSNVVWKRGVAGGWDCSNNGFYFITEESQKECGTKKKNWEKQVDGELEIYTQWANGEVYGYRLEESKIIPACEHCGRPEETVWGETDSCCGFYSIKDILALHKGDWKLIQD